MSTSRRGIAKRAARPYHHGDLRATLVATTRALLAEGGVEALSIREVSRRANVSNAAAYNHFTGRGDLVRAVAEASFVELAHALRAAQGTETDPVERLLRAGRAYVTYAMTHPAEFRVMFRPELCGDTASDASGTFASDAYRVLTESVDDCLASGAIEGDAPTLVMAAWSTVHGLATLALDGPPAKQFNAKAIDALARALTTIIVRGMQP